MSLLPKSFALVLVLVLAACGFSPMYGQYKDKNAVAGLDHVEIATIPNAEGIYLRNELIDRFYESGYPVSPTHKLAMSTIFEEERNLDITISSEATRKQVKLNTNLNLIDLATGQSVLNRSLTAIASYNVVGSQFATRIAEKDAREAALTDLARQVETQLSLYLNR